ncbi:MAG TPA: hypothetical protein PK402_02915 [Tepidisphaeraceae bacterium]|nr:hypothetical protein [Tepidisphaeraceae bacterium]
MSDDFPSLDRARIRRLATLRRSQHRSALFMLGMAALCIVIACASINEAIDQFRQARYPSAIIFTIIAPTLLSLARKAWLRRQRIVREIAASALEEPTEPPDFSTLQDGRQLSRSLEDIID